MEKLLMMKRETEQTVKKLCRWLNFYGRQISDVLFDDDGGYYINTSPTPIGGLDRVYLPEIYQQLELY